MHAQMLVVNGIESEVLNNINEINYFENKNPIGSKKFTDAVYHIRKGIRVRKEIVGCDDCCGAMLFLDRSSDFSTEKIRDGFDSGRIGSSRDILGCIYSQNPQTLCFEALQQSSFIATNIDCEGAFSRG
jgi:hypothetical protein